MEKKTQFVKIRLTPSQAEQIKSKAAPFGSMTAYILSAIKEFSDSTDADQLKACTQLSLLFKDVDVHLAHIGGNINQAMHKVNELFQQQLPYADTIKSQLMPLLDNYYASTNELRKELRDITCKYAR